MNAQHVFDLAGHEAQDTQVIEIDPNLVAVSRWNGRMPPSATEPAMVELIASIRAAGQIQPVIVIRRDGRFELVAGSRRRLAARELGIKLRAIVHQLNDDEHVFAVAHGENDGRHTISMFERAMCYAAAIDEGLFQTDSALASAVGVDKSTVSRALALARAPAEIINLIKDRREISARQWSSFAPLLTREPERQSILDRAALLLDANGPMPAAAAFSALMNAKDLGEKSEAVVVANVFGRQIARIQKTARGGINVSIAPLHELHPEQRREWTREVNRALSEFVSQAFPKLA